MRDFETKFEIYDDTAPEKVGEFPKPLPSSDAGAWDSLKDVPFAGDGANTESDEQAVAALESDIPSEDLMATEQASEALEELAYSATDDQADISADVADLSDDYAREDAAFDVQSGEWIDDSSASGAGDDLSGLADAETSEIADTADYSDLSDSYDAGDSGSMDGGSDY